jgi:hypothetical protein
MSELVLHRYKACWFLCLNCFLKPVSRGTIPVQTRTIAPSHLYVLFSSAAHKRQGSTVLWYYEERRHWKMHAVVRILRWFGATSLRFRAAQLMLVMHRS